MSLVEQLRLHTPTVTLRRAGRQAWRSGQFFKDHGLTLIDFPESAPESQTNQLNLSSSFQTRMFISKCYFYPVAEAQGVGEGFNRDPYIIFNPKNLS